MLFENSIMTAVAFLRKKFVALIYSLLKKEVPYDENEEMIDAPDLYYELNFQQLTKEFKIAKVEKQKYQVLKQRSQKDTDFISPDIVSKYIEPYIKICERNEKDIKDRMNELVDKYITRINKSKLQNIKTQDQKTIAVKNLYLEATDINNPNRNKLNVEQDLHGRISNNVCSYDLMDNPKYHKIEECLGILNERLGETEQQHQLMKMKTFASNSQSAYLSMQRKMSSVNRLVAINSAFRKSESGTPEAKERQGINLSELEKIASASGTEGNFEAPQTPEAEEERAETPEQRSASMLDKEISKSNEYDKLTRKVTDGNPNVMMTDQKDESCDKTQLMDDQVDATYDKSIHNIFTPGSIKSPKSINKMKSKSKSPKSPTRSKSPKSRTKSPKIKSPASKQRTPIGKALKEAIPKLKEQMQLKTETSNYQSPSRTTAIKSVVNKQEEFRKLESQAISATQKKIIAEQMARVSQMKMTGSTILGSNTSRGVQPREMFHQTSEKKGFNFRTVKPKQPQMRQTQDDFGARSSMMAHSESQAGPAATKEAAQRQMQDERIKSTIKQIQKMQNQQKAQKLWNDRSRQNMMEQQNSLASLSSASVYGKMPKQIMNMAKQNQMLQSAMIQHLKLSQKVQERNAEMAASNDYLDQRDHSQEEMTRSARNRSKDSSKSTKSNKNSQKTQNSRSRSKSPSQKKNKKSKQEQENTQIEMGSIEQSQTQLRQDSD